MGRRGFVLLSVALLLVEGAIALWVRDALVRPYGGDLLAVVLLYTLVRSVYDGSPLRVTAGVLTFAFALELLQGIGLVERLGLGHSALARTIIGTSFAWGDLLAYTLGALVVLSFSHHQRSYSWLNRVLRLRRPSKRADRGRARG